MLLLVKQSADAIIHVFSAKHLYPQTLHYSTITNYVNVHVTQQAQSTITASQAKHKRVNRQRELKQQLAVRFSSRPSHHTLTHHSQLAAFHHTLWHTVETQHHVCACQYRDIIYTIHICRNLTNISDDYSLQFTIKKLPKHTIGYNHTVFIKNNIIIRAVERLIFLIALIM